MIYVDYFIDDPLQGEVVFQRHFRMNRKVFMKIVMAIGEFDTYFICKKYCVGTVSFSSIQKCAASLRMLAYEAPSDTHEDYLRRVNNQVRQDSGGSV